MPPQDTKLGSGIGIHGWAYDWNISGDRNLTWGSISMLNTDLEEFDSIVSLKTKILIVP